MGNRNKNASFWYSSAAGSITAIDWWWPCSWKWAVKNLHRWSHWWISSWTCAPTLWPSLLRVEDKKDKGHEASIPGHILFSNDFDGEREREYMLDLHTCSRCVVEWCVWLAMSLECNPTLWVRFPIASGKAWQRISCIAVSRRDGWERAIKGGGGIFALALWLNMWSYVSKSQRGFLTLTPTSLWTTRTFKGGVQVVLTKYLQEIPSRACSFMHRCD